MNVAHLLVRSALRYPDRPLWMMPDRSMSYASGKQRLDAIALRLLALGQQRDRVAILCTNRFEGLEIYLAAMHAGMAATPMNPKLHPSEYEYMIRDSGAAFLVYSQEFEQIIQSLSSCLPAHVYCIGGDDSSTGRPYEDLAHPGTQQYVPVDVDPDDVAWLFYTSGTTGKPKGAMETHRNLLTMVQQFLTSGLHDISERDVMLHLAPISHGTSSIGLVHLARGAAQAFPLSRSFEPAKVFQAIDQYGVTATMLAPTMVQMLAGAPERTQYDLSTLRNVIYGGAPMHQAVLESAMAVFGPIFTQGYGQAEAPAICTCLPKSEHVCDGDPARLRRLASVGREPVGMMLRIVDDQNRPVPFREPGEIVVKGDLVMRGYWNNPKATAEVMIDGWLHTGDVGYLDEDGYLFLTDRKKDMIISGGSNIYSREVEEILFTHPAVAEAAVIGVPDATWGESVLAVVVLRTGMNASEQEIIEHCRMHIASFKKPRTVVFAESLPKSAFGKVLKRELRERFAPRR